MSRLFVLGFWIVVGLPAAAYWISEPRPADVPSADCSAGPAIGAAGDQRAARAGPSGAPCPPALSAKVAAVKQPTGSQGQ